MHLEEIKAEIARIARRRGWSNGIGSVPTKFVCALTELGEAGNAWKENESEVVKAEELADTLISLLDLSRVLCPSINMDNIVGQKLSRLGFAEKKPDNLLVIDPSVFFSRDRFIFLLKLLEEEELSPKRTVLADGLYDILSESSGKRSLSEKNELFLRDIMSKWEGFNAQKALGWVSSSEFLELLDEFFQKWRPLPASEFIGKDRQKNPIDAEELQRKLGRAGEILYDELKTAQRTRSCIVCLSGGLTRLLHKLQQAFIEVPHIKKKKWMMKHRWFGKLVFLVVFEVAREEITQSGLESLLSEMAKNHAPIVQYLLVEMDIPTLARWLLDLLGPILASVGVGLVTAVVAYDSVSAPRTVL
jgi:NTP pyrophosphatase (non-canonical NTP hydrolase)